jgi:hypothetical protein
MNAGMLRGAGSEAQAHESRHSRYPSPAASHPHHPPRRYVRQIGWPPSDECHYRSVRRFCDDRSLSRTESRSSCRRAKSTLSSRTNTYGQPSHPVGRRTPQARRAVGPVAAATSVGLGSAVADRVPDHRGRQLIAGQ